MKIKRLIEILKESNMENEVRIMNAENNDTTANIVVSFDDNGDAVLGEGC